MTVSRYKSILDNQNKSYREDPSNNELTEQAVTDQTSQSHLVSAISMQEVMALLTGTLPEVNYDQIKKITVTATNLQIVFYWLEQEQFRFDIQNPSGDFDINIFTTNLFTLEQGYDNLLLENGDSLQLEG